MKKALEPRVRVLFSLPYITFEEYTLAHKTNENTHTYSINNVNYWYPTFGLVAGNRDQTFFFNVRFE